MKTQLIAALLVAVSAAVAAPAFAGDSTVTRSQVRAELAALQKAGYLPNRPNDPNYPDNLQAALPGSRQHRSRGRVAGVRLRQRHRQCDAVGSRSAVRTAERSIYGH